MRASRSWKPASDAPGSRHRHPSTLYYRVTVQQFEAPDPVMNRVFEFLGLPPHRIPAGSRRKPAYASIQPELRERLQGYFSRDQKRLERLLR